MDLCVGTPVFKVNEYPSTLVLGVAKTNALRTFRNSVVLRVVAATHAILGQDGLVASADQETGPEVCF